MIAVRALQKRFHDRWILDGIEMDLAAGGLGAIVGLSGAGKSTLLRCLVGLDSFERGSVQIEDTRVMGVEEDGALSRRRSLRALRGRVGFVFQSFELFPHLTVLDNCVLAPMKVRGVSRRDAEDAARALLEQLGLDDKHAWFPDHLSGGQRQRAAIARALAMEPRVLLYDEPTSALDASFRREVRETLKRVQATGVTQVVVTHDTSLALEAADRLFVLDGGRIVEQGETAGIIAAPQHEATRRLLKKS